MVLFYQSIALQSCDKVEISGLTSLNSQGVHIHINGCNDVSLQNLKLIAPADSPNTDGIHVGNSRLFRVRNSTIATGDDCISIGPGSRDMRIERIQCGPGHGIRYAATRSFYENFTSNSFSLFLFELIPFEIIIIALVVWVPIQEKTEWKTSQ